MCVVFIILIVNFSSAKYISIIDGSGEAEIAKPIFYVKSEEEKNVEFYKGMKEVSYSFEISNNIDGKRSEVDLDYVISIENQNENFPVEYSLYSESGEKIELLDNKTSKIEQKFDKEQDDKYILKVKWKEIDEDLAESSDIKIKVEAVEKRK